MRLQLFEFGDLENIPRVYHDFLREFMGFLYRNLHIHKLWLQEINLFIEQNNKIHDPCAGSGDVNYYIEKEIDENIDFQFILSDIMTDRVPRFAKTINSLKRRRLTYLEYSLDLLKASDSVYPKIFINAFHHFTPEQVKVILNQQAKKKQDMLILEYCQKTLMSYFSMIMGPFMSMILFPFIIKKKDLISGFILTYIIPIIPFMLLWDGFISCFRTYSENDLMQVLNELEIKDLKIITKKKRSLLYPSGVSSIQIIF